MNEIICEDLIIRGNNTNNYVTVEAQFIVMKAPESIVGLLSKLMDLICIIKKIALDL